MFEPDPFPPLERVAQARADRWENQVTGVGTWARDKAERLEFQFPQWNLSQDFDRLSAMYHYDPLCKRIVDSKPKHMFRRGWRLDVDDEAPGGTTARNIEKYVRKLTLVPKLRKAAAFGRLYGGCLAIVGANDGQALDKPLDEANIRSIDYVNIQDRRYCYPIAYYTNLKEPKLGEPAVYRVMATPSVGLMSAGGQAASVPMYDVHESRVVRFDGADTDDQERLRLNGWTHSVLTAPYEEVKRFMSVVGSTANLLADASQGVYKLKGLMQQLGSKQGKALLDSRMQLIDMSRSVARSLLLDADGEDFTRIQTSFQNIPELLDRFMQLLSMVTGIPVTILMGRSAAGMNATGDSDFRSYYDDIETDQIDELEPKLQKAYRFVTLAKDGPTKGKETELTFTFRPLWVPTDKERADTNYAQAQADAIYLDRGVLTGEEVAVNRFKDGRFNPNTVVDLEAREQAAEEGVSFDPYPNDPEPEVDPQVAVTPADAKKPGQ